ncbi:uncharacterized protein LOC119344206 [Triticum dicoccoides]|uniref:uncharacterized protein LOC119344205 n=1 Tax=Triticum dicoccoides TaxID=85692 RepID=UPI00188F26AF|nr:uncharacterized protein LOC119344205 [Triticum dicoccoides]XP_037470654.1 uncharacterized protein LOC119344206 [Triticum dicoccoides]
MRRKMEAKRSRPPTIAALCVLLLLVLLPGEVAAKSKFCKCFDDCFPGCTNDDVPRFLCKVFCANKCSPNQAARGGDAMCRMACNKLDIEICGWSAAPTDAADAAICVESCNKKWSHN